MGVLSKLARLLFVVTALFLAVFMKPAVALTISEFAIPTASSGPSTIVAGPDGNLWFTEYAILKIGKITPAGVVTEYGPLSGQPSGITSGPDGNLWFTVIGAPSKVGKITPAGVVTEYSTLTASANPGGIVTGPDGNLWFTEGSIGKIGKITTSGVVTEYTIAGCTSCLPVEITAGPDGNLWFTELNTGTIGRITTAGVITEFATPSPSGWPRSIVSGPDGNLWFTEDMGNRIGKITTAGVVTEYLLPTGTPYTSPSRPVSITVGPDGNLWFTEGNGNKIGMITTAGVITEYAVPTAASWPYGITTGPDGRLWFLENGGNKVGAVGPASSTGVASSLNPSTNGQSVTFTVTVTGSTPTGTMQFKDGTSNLGAPVALSAGSATYSTSALSTGSHSITAVYGGDANNVGSTSAALTQTVNAALVNGACVTGQTLTTAPVNPDLCTAGTASAVTPGNTSYTWSCNGSNGGTNATNCSAIRNYVVTASVSGGNGTVSASQNVAYNATPSFTLTPDSGYVAGPVTGTCGGALVGNSYTTNAVTADCTMVASFSAIVNGACVAGQTLTTAPVNPDLCTAGTASAVTPGNTSYTWSCNGSNGGTNATNCSAIRNYVVTSSVSGGNGTVSASQNAAYNATPSFTLTPNAGFISGPVTGTCGGILSGNSYTTSAVTANCTVVAGFTLRTTYTGTTATSTGTATATVSGGGATCGFTTAQFVLPSVSAPAGVSFPHGLFDFTLSGCTPNSTVTMNITYPSVVPAGAQYWKYGPTPGNNTPHWYTIPANISGNTVTFSITDGGLGDDDITANGTIVDQGGPGLQATTAIPTLSEWGMILLAGLLGLFGMGVMRRDSGAGR